MKFTAAILFGFLTLTIAGCSMTHGDPKNPKQNPHPLQRYEVIATADAPGPWDAVSGYIGYDVVSRECTPENKFLGVHIFPQDVGLNIEMTRVDDKTWKGYFYRDYMLDEDYYGLGCCHWDATSVSADFVVHRSSFNSGDVLKVFLGKGPTTEYFRKNDFTDHSRTISSYGTTPNDPEITRHSDAFFPITVTVKEITP